MNEQADIEEFTTDNTSTLGKNKDVRLKHLARINPTKSEISDIEQNTDISFVELENFGTDGEIKKKETRVLEDVYDGYTYFREGDIAIAKITPSFENGKGAICRGLKNGIGFGTTELHVLRPRQGVSAEYLWYVLRSKPFMDEAETAMRGVAGQQRVPAKMIENFEISLPTLQKQQEIVDFLSEWDDRLDTLVKCVENLSKRISERRLSNLTKKVTKGVKEKQLVNQDSKWFNQLPYDWRIVRLKYLITGIEQGWSPQCNEIPASEDQWGVLKVGCVNSMSFDSGENKELPQKLDPKKELRIESGDILMSRANTRELVGSCAIAEDPAPKLILCDKLYRIDINESVCLSKYLVYVLNSAIARNQIELDASGASSSMVNISQKFVKGMKVPLPPFEEQKQIVDELDKEIERNGELQDNFSSLLQALEEKRQALITAAVTGQIDTTET
jgi:type I restriction enzyme S subunit